MNKEIKTILADLYRLDPSLKKKEKKIIRLINDLLSARQAIPFDPAFKEKLWEAIMAEISGSKNEPEEKINLFKQFLNINFMKMKWQYALPGVAGLALIIVAWSYWGGLINLPKNLSQPKKLSFNFSAEKLAAGAFDFSSLPSANQNPAPVSGESALSERSYSADGDASSQSAAAPKVMVEGRGGGGGGVGMIYPGYFNYEYVYKGGELKAPENALTVYKRVKGFGSGASASSFISASGISGLDFGKLSNPRLDNFSLNEDRDFGYITSVNLAEGNISIYQNWNRWPQANLCSGGVCQEPKRLGLSDIPADQEIIAIADRFLSDYGISTDNYGAPFIQDDWRARYEKTENKADFYYPEAFSVVYPLIIDGNEILDEGGNKFGMNVNVDVRNKKASGLWNYNSENYQTSDYEPITDMDKVLSIVKNGGNNYQIMAEPMPEANNPQTKTVQVGDPQMGLVKMWIYSGNDNQEFLVPCFIFPIINAPAELWQKNIVIPAVAEIFNKRYSESMPTPLYKDGRGGDAIIQSPALLTEPAPADLKTEEE